MNHPRTRRPIVLLVIAAVAGMIVGPASAAHAEDYEPIAGAGSSWSSNAIEQWRRNVKQFGMEVQYASTGSSDGRNQFKAGTAAFASSEIPYGIKDGGVVDLPPSRGYAYMPLVAGGTAFMYNLSSGGKSITNLRLSGSVLTKIFTGVITSWDDAAIKADNPGLSLPKRKIVPVVRSDGSGSTAQFTTWMANQYGSLWDSYCAKAGRSTPCGVTSNYPTVSGKGFVAQPNSQGVSGYVAQKANIGTITYVEYSYALKTGYPVAKILNKAGYYVEPTASNVAVGLLGAKINTDKSSSSYLTQILTGVFNNKDARAYPLSSYSYLIVPTAVESNFTEGKGKTLGAFAYYFLCEGQQQAEVLGYSPLPINLVKAGLEQVRRIPGVAAKSIDISKCNNPTFSKDGTNTLAKKAPQPPACDKQGAPQCTTGTGGSKAETPTSGNGGSDEGTTDGGSTDGGTDTSGGSTDGGGTTTDGPVYCEADTGVCANVVALPVEVESEPAWGMQQTFMTAAVLLVLGLVVIPPVLGQFLARRKKQS
jgi:phosphate ABC transporter phosphate-binding protein